jgi:hypothetical protein
MPTSLDMPPREARTPAPAPRRTDVPAISVLGLKKSFGDVRALDGVDL